jgi:hypothetical protein
MEFVIYSHSLSLSLSLFLSLSLSFSLSLFLSLSFSLSLSSIHVPGVLDRRKKKRKGDAQEFHLLHISLLREYLFMEFARVEALLDFPFEPESMLDDFVLLCFLIGNDFVPNLPGLGTILFGGVFFVCFFFFAFPILLRVLKLCSFLLLIFSRADIASGDLNHLIALYLDALPSLGGYINIKGCPVFSRLELIFGLLSQRDQAAVVSHDDDEYLLIRCG